MAAISLSGHNLSMSFGAKNKILSEVNIELCNGEIIGITGPNGSGKSTLLKVLCDILRPTRGKVVLSIEGTFVEKNSFHSHIGYVAPYLNLYEEFTPIEHIKLSYELKGLRFDLDYAEELIAKFNLEKHSNKMLATFSSGMKQRMKIILALVGNPDILFLDEPMTNLDKSGIEIVRDIILTFAENGGCILIASNDEREKILCQKFVSLG